VIDLGTDSEVVGSWDCVFSSPNHRELPVLVGYEEAGP